jgi:hypothetical protein
MSKKLEQVLEYLIAGKQEKAKELLHQVFLDKARKIHEDIMHHDDMDSEDDMMSGDEGDDWIKDITGKHDNHLKGLSDEIDSEEFMSEEEDDIDIDVHDDNMDDDTDNMDADTDIHGDIDVEDDDIDMDYDSDTEMDMDTNDDMSDSNFSDDMDSTDSESGDMGKIEDTIGDLEDILGELKAEFERLESGEDSEEVDTDMSDENSDDMDFDTDSEDMDSDSEDTKDEDEMDESWLDEDWDELSEAIELEKVKVEMGGEVGSGKFQPSDANSKSKSPVPTSQSSRMGAKPVKVEDKPHTNFNRETAPTSKDMGLSNRRKTAETGMAKVSKEGNKAAALNKTESEFGIGETGKNSPLTKTPRK